MIPRWLFRLLDWLLVLGLPWWKCPGQVCWSPTHPRARRQEHEDRLRIRMRLAMAHIGGVLAREVT